MASSSHVKNQKNRVLDPGAAEFSRRRRIFDVRRKSAEKFDLATIRRRRKKIWRLFSAAVLKCRGYHYINDVYIKKMSKTIKMVEFGPT